MTTPGNDLRKDTTTSLIDFSCMSASIGARPRINPRIGHSHSTSTPSRQAAGQFSSVNMSRYV